ncbi:MAG: tRNA (adenosine(37)-N6)-threonylcarbamoyltransferase complex transferase subunit TsaD [Victivallales bacterium]|nr:tRNA (adenosine(37)-N6)-threonylcarbamoyltransferase complex transferase subunit TsaD [Victivallales bacterium]
MLILGIESSCDETAASVVRDGHEVLSSVISSQIKLHAAYGGVIPELAAREHLKNIVPVVESALAEAGVSAGEIDGLAVTSRPGLIPALLVGNAYAKGLVAANPMPIVGINHFEGHLYGAFIGHPELLENRENYPILGVVVSGGHTALVLVPADGRARIVGTTLDDAAGEALDKAAKILGLGYPGGPVIDRIAKNGNPKAYNFPRGLIGGGGKPVPHEHRFDFSFSGVKTSLLYAVKDRELSESELADVVASYQAACMGVLVTKAMMAAKEFGARMICLAGGVACNSYLRQEMAAACEKEGRTLLLAPPKFCTDNAAMIAGLGYHHLKRGWNDGLDLPVNARLPESLGIFPFACDAASERG